MSHMLSDEDSTDSDSGIRFKTENTRKLTNNVTFRVNQHLSLGKSADNRFHDSSRSSYLSHSRHRDRSKDRKYSRERHNRSRSKEQDRYKRSRSHEKDKYKGSTSGEHRKNVNKSSRHDTEKSRDCKRDDRRYSNEKNRDYECSRIRRSIENENTKSNLRKDRESSSSKRSEEPSNEKHKNNSNNSSVVPKKIRKNSDSSISDSEDLNNRPHPFLSKDKPVQSVKLERETYGPVRSSKISKNIPKQLNSDLENQNYGPKPPAKSKIELNDVKSELFGPVLPSKLNKNKKDTFCNSADNIYGPVFSNSKSKTETNIDKKSDTCGTILSKNISKNSPKCSENSDSEGQDVYGPVLPSTKNKIEKLVDNQCSQTPSKLSVNKSLAHLENSSLEEENINDSVLSSKLKKETQSDHPLNEIYGPTPPKTSSKSSNGSENETQNIYGPIMPPHLPKNNQNDNLSTSNNDTFGPSLPTHLKARSTENQPKILGPSLPPHLREKLLTESQNNPDPNISEEIEDSDDDMIGPLPEGHSSKNISHKLLEERALEMRINALNPTDTTPKREVWMTQLPDVHRVNLGLGPRQFRAKEGPDLSDRSSWTDMPEDKERKTKKEDVKIDIKEKSKLEHIAKRDKEQEEIVKKHKKKKKRDKALIQLHQEKLAKKKKEESGMAEERRPFDRDIDLKVNRFDEAQKKAILKKAQLLDTRFSTGESKFL